MLSNCLQHSHGRYGRDKQHVANLRWVENKTNRPKEEFRPTDKTHVWKQKGLRFDLCVLPHSLQGESTTNLNARDRAIFTIVGNAKTTILGSPNVQAKRARTTAFVQAAARRSICDGAMNALKDNR